LRTHEPRCYHLSVRLNCCKSVYNSEIELMNPLDRLPPSLKTSVALLTGGGDKPYAFGMARALTSNDVILDFIGSDELDCPDLPRSAKLKFLNFRGDQSEQAPFIVKARRIIAYYLRLMWYAGRSHTKVLHILWNNRFLFFDRTLLMLYYKAVGKRIAFTAHNVNAERRDGKDSLVNRIGLGIQYRLADHIFVHTEKMKQELIGEFGIRDEAVSVIPFGINNVAPHTNLTSQQARKRLCIRNDEKVILFFGRIGPYKGLDLLWDAFERISSRNDSYTLLLVGKPKSGAERYIEEILRSIRQSPVAGRVIERIEFIPDEETEIYFKACDVVALPYTEAFQSGVLFLAYSFGVPVIAADVGSFAEDVVIGRTGLVCEPCDAGRLAAAIECYFASEMYRYLEERRETIRSYVQSKNSWNIVAEMTRRVYLKLEGQIQA